MKSVTIEVMFKLIRRSLSLDYRSLALYRVLIGFILMADVIYRWPDLTNFYTDVGLIPRALFLSEMTMPWSFSLLLANGSLGFAAVMFGLQFIMGVMLVVGYKSRWAMIGAYLMAVSVHNRCWLVNNGGDDILRAILFISIFLPLDRVFAIDSALTSKENDDKTKTDHFSTWGLAFFFQVFAIYFVGYLLKDSPIWTHDFTAVFYSSRLDIFATPIGVWSRGYPFLQKVATAFTIYLEMLGPLLLVFSFIYGRRWWMVRIMLVILFFGLHMGILTTMWIGIFPFICFAMWTIFLPGEFWEMLFKPYRSANFGKLKIYYDQECGFCKKSTLMIREFFLLPEVDILPAQENPSIYKKMMEKTSWVIVNEKGENFYQYQAFIELMRHSPLLKPVTRVAQWITPIGDKVYFWVSHNRMVMSRYSQFLEPRSKKKPISWLNGVYQLLGAVFFATLLMWNLTTVKKWKISSPVFQNIARWIHVYQEWNMFAPFPKMDNVWVEIPATLSDGSDIELITGDRDIYSVKAAAFYKSIKNEHWRKFYLNVSDRTDYARYYGGFLCRLWNERKMKRVPDTTLRKMEIIVYSQPILPNGGKGGIQRKLSWKHWCFDEDMKRDQAIK